MNVGDGNQLNLYCACSPKAHKKLVSASEANCLCLWTCRTERLISSEMISTTKALNGKGRRVEVVPCTNYWQGVLFTLHMQRSDLNMPCISAILVLNCHCCIKDSTFQSRSGAFHVMLGRGLPQKDALCAGDEGGPSRRTLI